MNSLLFSILLLSVVGIFIATNACCPYPPRFWTTTINVTKEKFRCDEPVKVTCWVPEDWAYTAIWGNATEAEDFKPIPHKKDKEMVVGELTCDTSASLWKMEGVPGLFRNFSCIAKLHPNGVWYVM